MILPEIKDGAVAAWIIALAVIAEIVVIYWPS